MILKILALFTVLSLILFWPIFVGKVNLNGNLLVSFYPPYGENLPYKNTGWDQLRIYFPFLKVTQEAYKNFSVPLWNPYAFSGHPHMADFQTAVFYPLNIFGLFVSQVTFWHFLRITPQILAGFFTYLYLRNLTSSVILGSRVKLDDSRIDSGQARMTGESRGLSTLAAIFGALTFGFSPFILTWGEEVVMSPHSIVWLPLILWAIDKYLARGERKFLAVIAVSSAFSFLGGYLQTTIYMFIFVLAYLIFRTWQLVHLRVFDDELRRIGAKAHFGGVIYVLSALILGAGIAAVQLLPSAELFFNSARSQIALRETLFDFLLPMESLLTYLAPDFFGHPATYNFFREGSAQYYESIMFVGVAALIFALYAIFAKERSKLVMFLAIFGLVALSTTLDLPTSRLFLSLPIPFLSTSIANRVLFIPAFCIAVLSALGFDWWLRKRGKEIFKTVKILAILYFLIVFYLLLVRFLNLPYIEFLQFSPKETALTSLRNLVIPIGVFVTSSLLIFWGTAKHQRRAAILLIAISFGHVFYFSQKYFSFSEAKYVFPSNPIIDFLQKNQEYFRSWGVGEAAFGNNFATQYGLFWPEGYDSLNSRSYGEFTYAMQGHDISAFWQRSDAGLGALGETEEILANPARRRLIDMVGVRYVVAKDREGEIMEKNGFRKVFGPSSFAKPDTEGKLAVFENLNVMPRVFLASNYEGPPSIADEGLSSKDIEKARRKLIFKKLLASDFDWRNVLVLEKPSPISPQFGEGSAQILSYKPNEVIVKTKSDQPKLLYLSDNYYPGWKATVDGDETEILRANYTFRAVPLVGGEHEVRFFYDNFLFKMGFVISLSSLTAGLIFLFRSNKLLG